MNSQWKKFITFAIAASLGLFAHSAVYAQAMEIEPNNQCEAAQDLGAIALPFLLSGELTSNGSPSNGGSEIDFYKFTAAAGTALIVEQKGSGTNSGTLDDPFLGWFNSACELQEVNDDFMSLNPRLILDPPADGVIIIAASSCCDFDFNGAGFGAGSYELSIDNAPPSIGSISAQALDAISGAPLAGNRVPFAFFTLATCNGDDCSMIISVKNADGDGRVSFMTNDEFPEPLLVGTYELRAFADGFEVASSGPFFVGEAVDFDIGALLLNPPPITISDIEPCDTLPAGGGTCQYRVRVNNNTDKRTGGLIWSLVDAFNLGTELDFTVFEASTRDTANRFVARQAFGFDAFDSDTIEFQFPVPSSINNGAQFCTSLFVGLHPNPLFNLAQNNFLFCIEKNEGVFENMSVQAARKLISTASENR